MRRFSAWQPGRWARCEAALDLVVAPRTHGDHIADDVRSLRDDPMYFGLHPTIAADSTGRFGDQLVRGIVERFVAGVGLSPAHLIVRLAEPLGVGGSAATLARACLHEGLAIDLVTGPTAKALARTATSADLDSAILTALRRAFCFEPTVAALLGVVVRFGRATLRTNAGVVPSRHPRIVMTARGI